MTGDLVSDGSREPSAGFAIKDVDVLGYGCHHDSVSGYWVFAAVDTDDNRMLGAVDIDVAVEIPVGTQFFDHVDLDR
jgi:hypothetical protein